MTIKVICRKDQIGKNGTCPLFIRFTHERKVKYVALGISVLPEYWNDSEQLINVECENYREFQYIIDCKIAEYEKKIQRLEILEIEVNFDTLLDANSRKIPNQTITEYFDKLIRDFEQADKLNSASKYYFCLSSLKKFRSMDITFDKIDNQFLRDFELFLRKKGNLGNTIASKFTSLKSAYNKALDDGIFKPKENVFAKFKVGKLWTKTRKRAITKEDVLKLKNLELPKESHFGYMELSRDIFLFSYYTAGINFKDIATLRFCDIDNGRLHYSRHKTGKVISCQLLPDAQHIIDKYTSPFYDDEDYIFPILDRSTHITERQIFDRVHKVLVRVNSNLKKLSKMIGLKTPITTYTARHTYATVLKRSGVNIAIISESLGHSDLTTTQIYLDSFENSQIDEAMQNLL